MTFRLQPAEGSVGFIDKLAINQKQYNLTIKHSIFEKIANIFRRCTLWVLCNAARRDKIDNNFQVLNQLSANILTPIIHIDTTKITFNADLIKFEKAEDDSVSLLNATFKLTNESIFNLLRSNFTLVKESISGTTSGLLPQEVTPISSSTSSRLATITTTANLLGAAFFETYSSVTETCPSFGSELIAQNVSEVIEYYLPTFLYVTAPYSLAYLAYSAFKPAVHKIA